MNLEGGLISCGFNEVAPKSSSENSRIDSGKGKVSEVANDLISKSSLSHAKLSISHPIVSQTVILKCMDGELKVSTRYLNGCQNFQSHIGSICNLTFFSKKFINEYINALAGNYSLNSSVEEYLLILCLSDYLHQKLFSFRIINILNSLFEKDLNNWFSAVIFYFKNKQSLSDAFKSSFLKIMEDLLCGFIVNLDVVIKNEKVEAFHQITAQWPDQVEALDPKTQTLLGKCYAAGIGVDKNLFYARTLYQFAVEKGYEGAQFLLGLSYLSDQENDKKSHALSLLQSAADKGFANALFTLGMYCLTGTYVEKDEIIAFDLLAKAAKKGNVNARKKLYELKMERVKLDKIPFNVGFLFFDAGVLTSSNSLPHGHNFELSISNCDHFPIQFTVWATNHLGQKILSNIESSGSLEPQKSKKILNFKLQHSDSPIAIIAHVPFNLNMYEAKFTLNVLPPVENS